MSQPDVEKGLPLEVEAPGKQTIGRGSNAGGETGNPYAFGAFSIPLYAYQELPEFLKGNPYITDGYRVNLDTEMCVKSTFMCSNETVNIWSHLIGLVYFTLLMIDDNLSFLPAHGSDWGDHLTFTILNLCFQVCMVCSAGYHMFHCQSENATRRWLGLDLAGVSVGLCGCYFPGAYYAFYCDHFWQTGYMTAMSFLAFASLFAQAHPKFLSNHWYLRRLVLYSAIVFAGFIPVMHWVVYNGGFTAPIVQWFLPKILVMFLLAFIAGTFYVSKFPENYFPGKVNFIGSSHQWWHFMVVISFAWAHHCAVVIFLYWRAHTCPNTTMLDKLLVVPQQF